MMVGSFLGGGALELVAASAPRFEKLKVNGKKKNPAGRSGEQGSRKIVI